MEYLKYMAVISTCAIWWDIEEERLTDMMREHDKKYSQPNNIAKNIKMREAVFTK